MRCTARTSGFILHACVLIPAVPVLGFKFCLRPRTYPRKEHDFFEERNMSRVSKNRNYKDSVKDLDSVLEMNLRQWMSATPGLLEPEVQRLLEQMHEFARQIQRGGFAPAVQNLASDVTGSSSSRCTSGSSRPGVA